VRFASVLSPRAPELLNPHQSTWPAETSAQDCALPAAIATTPEESPVTATGTELSAVVPLPSWPESFLPQQSIAPAVVIAHVCSSPA